MLIRKWTLSWLTSLALVATVISGTTEAQVKLNPEFRDVIDVTDEVAESIRNLPMMEPLPEPLPEPKATPDRVEAWVGFAGLVVHDTDDSHTIYVVYTPDRKEVEVVVFQQRFEIYRRRFRTADITAAGQIQSLTPGLCRVFCAGGDDEVHYHLDIPCELRGEDGNDYLLGGDDFDVLCGGAGNDVIESRGGLNQLCGESGNDLLLGGRGLDFAYGGDGDDIIDLRDGSYFDQAHGGAGRDLFLTDRSDFINDFNPSEDRSN